MIAREAGLVLAAAAFLTRLPLRRCARSGDQHLNRSSRYFSLVGAGVGAAGAAALVATALILPLPAAVVLSVAATALVTGALHEDGLADTCDAFGGGATREDVLRILEDSRIGAFGALGLMLALSLKMTTLAHLPLAALPVALVCAHAFSRAACVLVMALGRYARREGGKTRAVATGVRKTDAALAVSIGLLPFAWAPTAFLWSVPITLAVCAALYAYFRARIGGYTGDCLGAIQQAAEISCYLAFVARA